MEFSSFRLEYYSPKSKSVFLNFAIHVKVTRVQVVLQGWSEMAVFLSSLSIYEQFCICAFSDTSAVPKCTIGA